MKPVTWLVLSVVFLVFVVPQCNIFAPSTDERREELARRRGAEGLITEGKLKMEEKEWEKARDLFLEALGKDSTKSEAFFYYGKCVLRMADVDLTDLWDEISPNMEDDTSIDDVPFLYNEPDSTFWDTVVLDTGGGSMSVQRIDSVYWERRRLFNSVSVAFRYLDYINTNFETMDGRVRREQYESDFLIEATVRAVLGMVDINQNDSLDWIPDPQDERDAFGIVCRDFKSLDTLELDSLKNISKDPKEINGRIDTMLTLITKADTSYLNLNAEILAAGQDAGFIEDIGTMLGDIQDFLPMLIYDDHLDNDSDYYDTDNNGKMDRMIWIDWDGDDRIDVEQNSQTYHLGDSAHILAFPQLYRPVLLDTAADSRFHRHIYIGGYTYEFIAGDWGVDEEIMDGEDNDRDGLTDEDTRCAADTLDDDGDGFHTDGGTDSVWSPMQWCFDNAGLFTCDSSALTVPPIDTASAQWVSVPNEKQYRNLTIMDTLPSTIREYRGTYTQSFTAGDYGIDEEIFDGLDNDNDGMIDEDVNERIFPEVYRDYLIELLRR